MNTPYIFIPFLDQKKLMLGVSIYHFWVFFYHFCQFLPTNMDGFLETQMGWRLVRFHWGVEQKRDYKTKHMGM